VVEDTPEGRGEVETTALRIEGLDEVNSEEMDTSASPIEDLDESRGVVLGTAASAGDPEPAEKREHKVLPPSPTVRRSARLAGKRKAREQGSMEAKRRRDSSQDNET
jgi:hypothetical protein